MQRIEHVEGLQVRQAIRCFLGILLDIRETGLSSEAFCQLMLNKHFVTMTPGHVFGDNCEGFVRISYANSMENLEIAMKRMNEALETL